MTAVAVDAKPRVILIDLSSIWWSAWHSSGEDAVSAAKERTLAAIRRIVGDGSPLVAICCDSGRSFRKDLAPEYKANRPDKDQAALGELDRVKDRLRLDGMLLWEAKGFEADDVIASAVHAARANGHDVLIASADKDLLQLVGLGVRQLRTHTWKEGGAAEVMTDFGIGPSQFGDWLALVGDKSDNIPGAPGVGPKTATALLRVFTNLETLYITLAANPRAVTDAIGRNAQSILESLKASKESVALARKLVALRTDAPIEFGQLYEERRPQNLTTFDEEPMDDLDSQSPESPPAQSATTVTAPPGPGQSGRTPSEVRRESSGDERVGVERSAEPHAPALGELPPPIAMPAELVELKPPAQEVRRLPVSAQFERQLEPADLKEAFWMAKGLFNARLFPKYKSAEAIWTALIRGREMGFLAGAALSMFHPMDDGLTMTSNAIQTVAEKLPDCEYIMCLRTDDKAATWRTKHRKHPDPEELTYTVEEAVQAGLTGLEPAPPPPKGQSDRRGNWDKRRANMLRKTARDNLIRMVYPAAAALYSAEGMGADIDD